MSTKDSSGNHVKNEVTKAKSLTMEAIHFGTPTRILEKNHAIPVSYNGNKLYIQLPRVQTFSDVYEKESKFFVDVIFSKCSILYDMYSSLATHCDSYCKQHTLFKDSTFIGHMRQIKNHDGDKYGVLRLKLPQNSGKIMTSITERNHETGAIRQLSTVHITPGTTIVPIIAMDYVYVINGYSGFNLLLAEAVVV
jgi:hypothetical protein